MPFIKVVYRGRVIIIKIEALYPIFFIFLFASFILICANSLRVLARYIFISAISIVKFVYYISKYLY